MARVLASSPSRDSYWMMDLGEMPKVARLSRAIFTAVGVGVPSMALPLASMVDIRPAARTWTLCSSWRATPRLAYDTASAKSRVSSALARARQRPRETQLVTVPSGTLRPRAIFSVFCAQSVFQ